MPNAASKPNLNTIFTIKYALVISNNNPASLPPSFPIAYPITNTCLTTYDLELIIIFSVFILPTQLDCKL